MKKVRIICCCMLIFAIFISVFVSVQASISGIEAKECGTNNYNVYLNAVT